MHRLLQRVINPAGEKKDAATDNKAKSNTPTSHSVPVLVIGKIYAEWCGHCKNLKPKWEVLQEKIESRYPNKQVLVYKVEESDMDNAEKGLDSLTPYLAKGSDKVAVHGGYPTIFKIRDGKVSYYEGPREVDDMMKWALEGMQSSPKSKTSATRRKMHKRSIGGKRHHKKSRRYRKK
jgi:thiol-disulfide isomerase/thioredoxin